MRQFPSCVFLDKRVYIDWKAGGEPLEGGDWWGHKHFVSKESVLVWEGQALSARMPLPSSDLYRRHFP